jgi:hypothetical protein
MQFFFEQNLNCSKPTGPLHIVNLFQKTLRIHIKQGKMDGTYSTHKRDERYVTFR